VTVPSDRNDRTGQRGSGTGYQARFEDARPRPRRHL